MTWPEAFTVVVLSPCVAFTICWCAFMAAVGLEALGNGLGKRGSRG